MQNLLDQMLDHVETFLQGKNHPRVFPVFWLTKCHHRLASGFESRTRLCEKWLILSDFWTMFRGEKRLKHTAWFCGRFLAEFFPPPPRNQQKKRTEHQKSSYFRVEEATLRKNIICFLYLTGMAWVWPPCRMSISQPLKTHGLPT